MAIPVKSNLKRALSVSKTAKKKDENSADANVIAETTSKDLGIEILPTPTKEVIDDLAKRSQVAYEKINTDVGAKEEKAQAVFMNALRKALGQANKQEEAALEAQKLAEQEASKLETIAAADASKKETSADSQAMTAEVQAKETARLLAEQQKEKAEVCLPTSILF